MNITRGKIKKAIKAVIYGPEGIGKSTFASQFPNPLFIDTEGSTNHMDLARFDKPSSWQMIKQQIQYVKENPNICDTLVIDTIDWAEQLCIEDVCATHHKSGIEEFGYGNGYVYTKEEFGRFLNRLDDLIDLGINVVLTAHAQLRKFEQPDEMGAYDRWELKLGKKTASQTSPLVKEWADILLFANYKVFSVATDKDGKKHKAQGGKRVMYTAHHPCWDAKNRFGLPEELDFDYKTIAHCVTSRNSISPVQQSQIIAPVQQPVTNINEPTHTQAPVPDITVPPVSSGVQMSMDLSNTQQNVTDNSQPPAQPSVSETPPNPKPTVPPDSEAKEEPPGTKEIPQALLDLMLAYNVSESDIQSAVASRGYYPIDTPIYNYDANFITGVLVGAWNSVYKMIYETKLANGEFATVPENQGIPFNN